MWRPDVGRRHLAIAIAIAVVLTIVLTIALGGMRYAWVSYITGICSSVLCRGLLLTGSLCHRLPRHPGLVLSSGLGRTSRSALRRRRRPTPWPKRAELFVGRVLERLARVALAQELVDLDEVRVQVLLVGLELKAVCDRVARLFEAAEADEGAGATGVSAEREDNKVSGGEGVLPLQAEPVGASGAKQAHKLPTPTLTPRERYHTQAWSASQAGLGTTRWGHTVGRWSP